MLRDVCGVRCDHDDHDPGDEWFCGLPPGHSDLGVGYHAGLVIGGFHQWEVGSHDTDRNGIAVPREDKTWSTVFEWGLRWPEPDNVVRFVGSQAGVEGALTQRFRDAGAVVVCRRVVTSEWEEVGDI